MLNWLISVPGPVFLVYFFFYSAVLIAAGTVFLRRADSGENSRIPAASELMPYEIAALRDELRGVIHAAVFNLWQSRQILFSDDSSNPQITAAENSSEPEDPVEKILYTFISGGKRKPDDLFTDKSLKINLEAEMNIINSRLENFHLLRKKEELVSIKKIRIYVLLLILFPGIFKLASGIAYGRPVVFLIIMLTLIFMAWVIIFVSRQTKISSRGRKFLKSLKDNLNREKESASPLLKVAAFGVAGIAGFAVFSQYQELFAGSSSDYSSSSDTGGCSSGCSGGGGCGGCGGGD